MEVTKRRNRLKPKPRKTSTGKTHRIQITKRDVDIFRILQRYRYLPTNFIFALLPEKRNYKKFQERLADLSGHGFLRRPHQQWDVFNAYYKKIVYELGAKGKSLMENEGLNLGRSIGIGNSYHHEALTCLIIASMEISCNEFRFIHWPELLNFKMVPETTKANAKPFHIPLIGMNQKHAVPDGTPFCIKGKRTICFAGTETDMGNEVLMGARRVTIEKKFEGYLNIARNRTYKKHFGFPNMVVPFVTTSETRMLNMMKLLEKITNGKGCSFILFKYTPHLRSAEKSPDPVDLLSSEWLRVGHPSFDLKKGIK